MHSLGSDTAERKTFELVAEDGPPSDDIGALFAPLEDDSSGALDAVFDPANMPLDEEPASIQDDVSRLASNADELGYRSTRNLIAMIYLMHGKLPILQPM